MFKPRGNFEYFIISNGCLSEVCSNEMRFAPLHFSDNFLLESDKKFFTPLTVRVGFAASHFQKFRTYHFPLLK